MVVVLCVLQDSVSIWGEVFFPNLLFDRDIVDFACIPNDTEATRFLQISNNSPLPVNYKWTFELNDSCKHVAALESDLLDYLRSSLYGLPTAKSIGSEVTQAYFEFLVLDSSVC